MSLNCDLYHCILGVNMMPVLIFFWLYILCGYICTCRETICMFAYHHIYVLCIFWSYSITLFKFVWYWSLFCCLGPLWKLWGILMEGLFICLFFKRPHYNFELLAYYDHHDTFCCIVAQYFDLVAGLCLEWKILVLRFILWYSVFSFPWDMLPFDLPFFFGITSLPHFGMG